MTQQEPTNITEATIKNTTSGLELTYFMGKLGRKWIAAITHPTNPNKDMDINGVEGEGYPTRKQCLEAVKVSAEVIFRGKQ